MKPFVITLETVEELETLRYYLRYYLILGIDYIQPGSMINIILNSLDAKLEYEEETRNE